ncbi:MAG: transcription termination/antitermination factor NusG [Actinobacteria bacterium]|nr:transcription termination/antitermination factor NusG [Actinomycetota bacterium]
MAQNDDIAQNSEQPEPLDSAAASEPTEQLDTPEVPVPDDSGQPTASDAALQEQEKVEEPENAENVEELKPSEGNDKKWLVLRVASNKEDVVRETLEKKVKIEGLEEYVGRILVPSERVKRIKGGHQRVQQRKLYPGYVFVEMALEPDGSIPEKPWFTIKETVGVGDFIGALGKPTPMRDHDVDKMLAQAEKPEDLPSLNIDFKKGHQVKIREGPFENFEGAVDEILADKGVVRVIVTIFGRATPLELEYWQLEPA